MKHSSHCRCSLIPLRRAAAAAAHAQDLQLLLTQTVLQALAELQVYNRSSAARHATLRDMELARRLTESLQALLGPSVALPAPLSVQTCLQQPAPEVDAEQRIPLTW